MERLVSWRRGARYALSESRSGFSQLLERLTRSPLAIRSGVVGTAPVDLVFGSTLDFDFRFPVDVVRVDWLLAA